MRLNKRNHQTTFLSIVDGPLYFGTYHSHYWGGQIGATWDYLRRKDGLEKKIEEKLASRKLEHDSVGDTAKYLFGQGYALWTFQTLFDENSV